MVQKHDFIKQCDYISPNNQRYYLLDKKLIIGKSFIKNEISNELVLCLRSVESVKIPSFIERICRYAFEKCTRMKEIEIMSDSKLRVIEDEAFACSSIEKIKIPRNVTQIRNFAFCFCLNFIDKNFKDLAKNASTDLHL